MLLFLVIAGILLLIIAIIIIKVRRSRNHQRAISPDSFVDDLNKMAEQGSSEDTLPEGIGEFGHDRTNPIPAHTIRGGYVYLAMLRTLDGRQVQYERLGSFRADNISLLIDGYDIIQDGKKIATLYISPYHKKNSARAPKGFELA